MQCCVDTLLTTVVSTALFFDSHFLRFVIDLLGQYQDNQAQKDCKNCGIGKIISDQGIVDLYHASEQSCQTCVGSTYNDLPGQGFCKTCPDEKSIMGSKVEEHDNVTDCVLRCELSEYIRKDTIAKCIECELGYYCDGQSRSECEAGKKHACIS